MKDIFYELTIRLSNCNDSINTFKLHETITEDSARSLCGMNYKLAINASKGINMQAFVNNVQFNTIHQSKLIATVILKGLNKLSVEQQRNLFK